MDDVKVIEETTQELIDAGDAQIADVVAKIVESADIGDATKLAETIVELRAIQGAAENEALGADLTDLKSQELRAGAVAKAKVKEVENKNADIKLQEADYGVYSGVAAYAGIKRPLPNKMQTILFCILSIFQTVFLVCLGIPVSVFNMVADGVDSIVKKIASLTKSAMWIVLFGLMVCAVIAVVFIIRAIVMKIGAN